MVKSEQQRQRKLAKKRTKDIQKRKEITRQQQALGSLAGKMQAAARGRVVYSGISSAISEVGIGHVVIAREAPAGEIAVAVILVDAYCLGVKDVFAAFRVPTEARELIDKLKVHGLRTASPGLARGLVEGAIEYARAIGFPPHADYRKVCPIWGDLPVEAIEGKFVFGRDGKPMYVNGPEDGARQTHIHRTLEARLGPGNYHITVGGPLHEGNAFGFENFVIEDFDEDYDEDNDTDDWLAGSIDGEVIKRFDNPEA